MSLVSDKLYTAAQVRQLDQLCMDEFDLDGYELMCRAGQAVINAALASFPDARRWVIMCGAGNNAGDGYVVARLAREQSLEVVVCALVDPQALHGAALQAARQWQSCGGTVCRWPADPGNEFELAIDALLGTGLDRPLDGSFLDAVQWLNGFDCPKLAVDIPTGLHADSGCVLGAAVRADLCVSFIGLKRGMFTADGPDHCGRLVYDELETPREIHARIAAQGQLARATLLHQHLPARPRNSHKGSYGHVLVVGGAAGMSGAVQLSARAALRAGAGLASIATHPGHAATLNLAAPELMVHAVADAAALDERLARATVIAVGPGLGTSDWSKGLLDRCLASALPQVVDADALNLLSGPLPGAAARVLTPHPAEAARLLRCETAEVQSDRIGAAQALASEFAAVVILKGCGSIICAPGGHYAICPLGNPGMATAGSGDVLTGVVAALLAQGLAPWTAACLATVAHAGAGDLAGKQGQRGLIASDIIHQLPAMLNS